MKKIKIFMLYICVLMILAIQNLSFAQYKIKHSVFGNGFAVTKDSSFSAIGLNGQPLVGESDNSSYSAGSGFIYQSATIYTAVEQVESAHIPKEFRLDQNYPNPFNPSTTIQFALPKECEVILKIFDLLGREVATVVDEKMQAGEYKLRFEAEGLPSGIYFYIIQTERFRKVKKFTLLK
jgi:hypothetical protein